MIEEFRELVRRVTELERRMANVIQTGTVSDVDYDKGRYRVQINEDRWQAGQNGVDPHG